MYSLKEIKKSLPKKKNSKSSLWVKLVVRKLSFIFTFLFINIGCSSWMASVISVFVSIGGCIALTIDNNISRIIGVMLINFWLIMDCVDGNIARVKKTSSEKGEFIDALSGYFITAFVFLSLGIAAYNTSNFNINKNIYIVIGAITSISGILARLIHQKYTYTILMIEKKEKQKKILPEDEVENHRSIQYIRNRIDKELNISGVFMPFIIISCIFNCFDIMILFYFAFQFLGLIAVTAYYSVKAR